MTIIIWVLLLFVAFVVLAYAKAPGWMWTAVTAFALAIGFIANMVPPVLLLLLTLIFIIVAIPMNIADLRRTLISDAILKWYRKIMPQVSQTEQEALDAGTVWWDGDLFSGNPDWRKLLAFPKPTLTLEEQVFLDGPVEQLCAMISDWQITHELNDLSPEAWQFIKANRFLGMIIPTQYGGLGFSALAHSEVIMKLSSRSGTAAVSVMVPNSLGPAELLLNYGTESQKRRYLSRLAAGEEMPCFALTGPEAGSDAGSIPDFGIVCKGSFEGQDDVLGVRVTWEKRYITLGPIATLLGLAFKLYDPDHLLGNKDDIGITLALIPTNTPGVNIGRRHFPLNASFQNGPNSGKDVFIPMEWIIGGTERVGQGWRMLMECLAAGRSISLPSSSAGAAKLAARTTGAYARVRTQFKLPIARFEGVEEALARIGGNTYLMDAARVMTAGAIDLGAKPSVISAIVKYHITERGRSVINDAMDVHGGKGICLGPSNYLGRMYQQIPIGITVEGANILTRSLIIFGQGAIRCHPYVLKEIAASNEPDPQRASHDFDAALFGHIGFTLNNAARSLVSGITGYFTDAPGDSHTRHYYRQLTRFSAAFALVADVSMLVLGGSLKRKEMLSARLGDVLSQLYLCSAVLKRYEDQSRPETDLPFLHWCMQDALHKMQEALDGVLRNFPNRILAWKMRFFVFPLGRTLRAPNDKLSQEVARAMTEPSPARDRLTKGIFIPQAGANEPVGNLEAALTAAIVAETVELKIRTATKAGQLRGKTVDELNANALATNLITPTEMNMLTEAKTTRRTVIMVDDFEPGFATRKTS